MFAAAALLLLTIAPQESRPSEELLRLLESAVDQHTPDARANAAASLALRPEPIEDWLAAARAFGKFNKFEMGVRTETVALYLKDSKQDYQIMSYVPSAYDPAKPAALMVAFHGSGGAASEMIEMWRPTAEQFGFIVVANTEPLAKDGFTFKAQEREAGLAMLRHARRIYNIDENHIYCTGISRGGHLTWDTALRYPDTFAAIFPMIGGPWAEPSRGFANLRYLPAILNLTIRDLQGAKDDPGLVGLLHYTFKKLKEMKAADSEYIEFPDLGHSFHFNAVAWEDMIKNKSRTPAPAAVVVSTVMKHDAGRASWAEVLGVGKDIAESVTPKMTQSDFDHFKSLGMTEQSAKLNDLATKQTARLDVSMTAPGKFTAKGAGVLKFRILLADSMFDPKKPLSVVWNGKNRNYNIKPDKKVFITEFVERFDRTFLPIAEARVE